MSLPRPPAVRRCPGPLTEADLVPGARQDISEHDRLELARFAAYLKTPKEMRPLAYGVLYPDLQALEGGDT